MSSDLIAQAVEYFTQREPSHVHDLLIVRHGVLVADVSFYPFQRRTPHDLASVSKSFMSALTGIAIDRGFLEGVDQRAVSFFPDRTIANFDDRKAAITIEHLLTHTSGLGGLINHGDEALAMQASPDPVQFALDLPMTAEPGTTYRYSNVAVFLLSAIIRQATGMSALDFARENLFRPLRIDRSSWAGSADGDPYGYGELRLDPYDLAKFGFLYLHGGSWYGTRVISDSWVSTSTTARVNGWVGYLWGAFPSYFEMAGSGGQRLTVSPGDDLVVVIVAGADAGEDHEATYRWVLDSLIFPAVQSDRPLPENPTGLTRLDEAARAAATGNTESLPPAPLPPIASDISGRLYLLEENAFELESVTLSFPGGDEARLHVTSSGNISIDSDFDWVAGLDGVDRFGPGRLGILAAGTGAWESESTLTMHVDEIGNIERWVVTLEFDSARVTITMRQLTGDGKLLVINGAAAGDGTEAHAATWPWAVTLLN